ncbi:MAG TPA: hypothetical protein VKT49_17240 [Bryobacteraceae bacterium]|nr:hypothetical protein [Bryobacteraceae bacterium]
MSTSNADTASQTISNGKRAAARELERKSQGDGDAKGSVPVPVSTQPVPALPLSLDFGLIQGIAPGKDGEADSQQAAGQPAAATPALDPKQDALQAPPDPLAEAAQPVAMPRELSFALKLDPQAVGKGSESAKDSKAAPEGSSLRIPAPVKTSAAAVRALEEAHAGEPQADAAAPRNDVMARIAAFQMPQQNPQASGAAENGAAARMESAKALDTGKALDTASIQTSSADSTTKASGPLKELSIQVGQTQQDRVELRVVDRSGEMQVAVRASNPDVAQGLRQGLSDLVGRLEQNGYRAEGWRPGGSVTGIQGTGESRQKEMQFQRDDSQSQSGGSHQGRQQNPQGQGYRPRWVQELEGSLSDGSNSTSGDSYGVTN